MNNKQREFNNAMQPFRVATGRNINNLNTFLNTVFGPKKLAMSQKNLARIARLGSEAYPNQARRILNLHNFNNVNNHIKHIPAPVVIGIINGLSSNNTQNRAVKRKAFMAFHGTYGNIYSMNKTRAILNALTKNLSVTDLRILLRDTERFINNVFPANNNRGNNNKKYNANIIKSLGAQIARRKKAQSVARGMVERLRNRQVDALQNSGLPNNLLRLIREKM